MSKTRHEGDLAEIMAVRRFGRAAPGKLAGKKKGGIQIFVSDVVLYLAHGMRYLVSSMCIHIIAPEAEKERLNFFLIRPVEVA